MISGNRLQDAVMAKEEAKIALKREQNEQRRLRILNAKARTIGLDIQALDAQVAEKQRLKAQDKEVDRFERLQAMEVERILAEADEEEKQMKAFQMQQIKESWEATQANKMQNNKEEAERIDFDENNCGMSSALRFSGEDTYRMERIKLQKEQMRRWIQEQISERAQLKHLQKKEEMTYAEMVKALDEIRLATEEEEKQLRKYIDDSMKEQNRELAIHQRERNRTFGRALPEFGNPVATSLNLFEEDKSIAYDANGRVFRRDMFKGFTEEQRKRVLYDNQKLLESKNMTKDQEKQRDYEWMIQQVMALRAMEQAEYEEKMLKEDLNNERLQYLQTQIETQRRDRNEWNKTKYGSVDGGFFDGFGKSCR